MNMSGYDVYRSYLAMKKHFTTEGFDYFKYHGKTRASEESYKKRSDFYFFETLSRKLTDQEVKEYLLSSFVLAEDPSNVWIGYIKDKGKTNWSEWQRTWQSIDYRFQQDMELVKDYMDKKGYTFDQMFDCSAGHPPLFMLHVSNKISTESMMILDKCLGYVVRWDKVLKDPLWRFSSMRIRKYKPFVTIDKQHYIQQLREIFAPVKPD